MIRKRTLIIYAVILGFALFACNLQNASPTTIDDIGTAIAGTMSAQTMITSVVADSRTAVIPATPVYTLTASITPLPTLTFTPAVPMISVTTATNCRTGPGNAYDMVGGLAVGKTVEVIGRDAAGQFWLIHNPSDPSTVCWLWGHYATVTGNTGDLPITTPPPTPTPLTTFTIAYKSLGVGPGFVCIQFTIQNTGKVTWESYQLGILDTTQNVNGANNSNEFTNYDSWCTPSGVQPNLPPGASGTVSANIISPLDPSHDAFNVSLLLCPADNLAGACVEKTIQTHLGP